MYAPWALENQLDKAYYSIAQHMLPLSSSKCNKNHNAPTVTSKFNMATHVAFIPL